MTSAAKNGESQSGIGAAIDWSVLDWQAELNDQAVSLRGGQA